MNILDIFYKEIISEATNGKVDCLFTFNILFNTKVNELNIDTHSSSDELVPTLIINDVSKFNYLLLSYVNKSLDFYKDDSILNDINDKNMMIKTIMTLLWSDATYEDFNDPVNYLNKKLAFLDNKLENVLFKSELLESDIIIEIKKSRIVNETPYYMNISLKDGDNVYNLPNIYFGISYDTAYIYAIQNKASEKTPYYKKINRKLFHINEGFDLNDNYENYDSGNLIDVSMSFVLAANICLSYLKNMGISKIVVPSILYSRWNAKELSLKKSDIPHDEIQANLTEKLIRTFRRLESHHTGIVTTSNPYELDSSIHLELLNSDTCNNSLLDETYNFKTKKK